MKYHASALAVCLMFLSAGTVIAGNCDAPDLTGFDRIYCLRKIYFGEDDRLNANYRKLRGLLNGTQRNTLKTAQLNWISWRNDSCMVNPDTVNVRCALDTTRNRADFLQARITECRTVGCATTKLSDYQE